MAGTKILSALPNNCCRVNAHLKGEVVFSLADKYSYQHKKNPPMTSISTSFNNARQTTYSCERAKLIKKTKQGQIVSYRQTSNQSNKTQQMRKPRGK